MPSKLLRYFTRANKEARALKIDKLEANKNKRLNFSFVKSLCLSFVRVLSILYISITVFIYKL
jgi:hypothetical protein